MLKSWSDDPFPRVILRGNRDHLLSCYGKEIADPDRIVLRRGYRAYVWFPCDEVPEYAEG